MINKAISFTLFQQLDGDTTVITPNRRLAATLHKLFQQAQQDAKRMCWETPDILPLASWIQRLWDENTGCSLLNAPLLLNTIQENLLWEDVIHATNEVTPLLQVAETAHNVKSAWGILQQWQVDLSHPLFSTTHDCQALHTWATHFHSLCQRHGWIDKASLTDLVIEKIKSNIFIPTRKIMLIGFTELSPQLKHLISTYEKATQHSVQIGWQHGDENHQPISAKRISLSDSDDEILTMARWAKNTLDTHDPAIIRIGCVIPSLDKLRHRVEQIFSDIFGTKTCFNISAGKPLLQCPMVRTALQLLAFYRQSIPLETFTSLLTSPFLGNAEVERVKRANFDSQLRRENITAVHFKTAIFKNQCPLLEKRIHVFRQKCQAMPVEQTYHEWAKVFMELLTILGWPGERSLNSEEYQIVEHWLQLLTEFSTLDQTNKPINIHRALQILHKMAAKSIFQPKTPDAPVQVLGLLEAAGLPFHFLWVSGLDDFSWPPQSKPNPFIPKQLQRELHMPHATAEREFIYCQKLTEQFKHNAEHIIFSHAEKKDDLELQASPLIRALPEITMNELNLIYYQPIAEKIYDTKCIETIVDDIGPAHISGEPVLGGIHVIKFQSMCPFKAFAEIRLRARELENPLLGLRAKDRGSLLHKVMELFWNRVHDHQTLCSSDEHSLTLLISDCINESLVAFSHANVDKQQYLSLEKKRLFKLVWDWLQIEKRRPPFTVLNNEKSAQITLKQMTLTVRIDRVDELENGKKLIIDYKTGKNNDISRWFGDKPEEPQLPLYSLLDQENTVGIAFAQIYPGDNCFKGISHHALHIHGITPIAESKKANHHSWPDQLEEWHHVLSQLSEEFYSGIAKVDPKNQAETCEWCALKAFCRIKQDQLGF